MVHNRSRSDDHDLIETLLEYMFLYDAEGRPDALGCATLWFRKSGAIDRDIRTRFGPAVQRAVQGDYDLWTTSPRGCVALAILVDQFPRNIYRDTRAMFCGQEVSRRILAQQHSWDSMPPVHQLFVPELILTHQEDLAAQRRCVQWFERLRGELPPAFRFFQKIFERHLSMIERFGRFPYRNSILGRSNTAAEKEFLLHSENRFDLAARLNPATGELEFGRHPDALWHLLEDEIRTAHAVDRALRSDDDRIAKQIHELSPVMEDEYRLLFGQLDEDGSGRLTAHDLARLFDSLKKPYSMRRLEAIVSHIACEAPSTGEAGLSFNQLVALLEVDLGHDDPALSFDELFSIFSRESGDEISVEGFYACIHAINPKITNTEIAAMLKKAGCSKSSKVSRDDFHRMAIELHSTQGIQTQDRRG